MAKENVSIKGKMLKPLTFLRAPSEALKENEKKAKPNSS